MWIVRLALRRPYIFIVMAMLIAIGGVLTISRTPVDIFPEINDRSSTTSAPTLRLTSSRR
jgi:multidrug efflux pump subunit AcrB